MAKEEEEWENLEKEFFANRFNQCTFREVIKSLLAGPSTLVSSSLNEYGAPWHASCKQFVYTGSDWWFYLDVCPMILCNAGPLMKTLLRFGLQDEHIAFEPLSGIYLVIDGEKSVLPMRKEDIQSDNTLTLQEKRLLMKAFKDFSLDNLPEHLLNRLNLAFSGNLKLELETFVCGLGAYICDSDRCTKLPSQLPAPYLVPHYGASSAVQAAARLASVKHGTVFALGNPLIHTIDENDDEKDLICILVLVTDRPLDREGCWMYRFDKGLILENNESMSIFQRDSSTMIFSENAPPRLYSYHCWPVYNANTVKDVVFNSHVIMWEQLFEGVPRRAALASASAERALLNEYE